MTTEIYAHQQDDSLQEVMEGLAAYRFGAVLVKAASRPAGVVSKTDLILAYKHGLPTDTRAKRIMTTPVQACDSNAPVVEALKSSGKINFFREISAIMDVAESIRLQKQKLYGIFFGHRDTKTIF